MSNRYLVTGAAGFIGSHVCDALLARGSDVVGLDNLNSYYDPSRKIENLEEVRRADHPGVFEMMEGDIRDPAVAGKVFEGEPYASVIHLAAMAGVRASIDDPDLYYDVNVTGTLRLLEKVKAYKDPPLFVFASTSSVYGGTKVYPFIETDPCDLPLVPYSASKRAAEMMGFWFHNVYGVDFTVLRFFTVYGPRGRPDMMAYKVAESVTQAVPVPLYNRGEMYRDWTYISDTVAGIVAAADRRLGYEVINLGRGEPVHLGTFVKLVEARLGGSATLIEGSMPVGDVPRSHADITKARALLDYAPKVGVEEGVGRFVDWYRRD